jgi:hypothetical protein
MNHYNFMTVWWPLDAVAGVWRGFANGDIRTKVVIMCAGCNVFEQSVASRRRFLADAFNRLRYRSHMSLIPQPHARRTFVVAKTGAEEEDHPEETEMIEEEQVA